MPPKRDKEHAAKKPVKTERQKKAEAEMMKTLITQYNGVLTSNELKAMKEVFDTYDTKNQGIIKTSLLGKILRTLGFNPLESDIQRVTKEIDPKNTDQLKFPEYVNAFLNIPTSVTDKDIIPAFQVFDTEKSGLLEVDGMMKYLTNIGEQLNEIEAKTFKDNLNIDEQGLFNYNDFFLKFTEPPKPKKKKKGKKKKKKSK
ncbi:unnamed protein product [Rotaria sordida]|uniref:EF-hand domain-containing protein n=1 Tax=Rotaria sordida TaxID=392033 RepID=A0A814BVM2_9BILA|nr:unnamed protein product [Rotaria sordida]CAF0933055.1 unnamed protein product [Rotaria sordida]CAF0939245.1 unnamed protein product [Rotaria sordida]CAF1082931.1 unnamed protein product [Rotaria sordida]CAF3685634.1 unnamed protein product [Rotaria sordida]